jgi:DNA-binding CsgD family transcriptional regulator
MHMGQTYDDITIRPMEDYPNIAVSYFDSEDPSITVTHIGLNGGIVTVAENQVLARQELNILALGAAGLREKTSASMTGVKVWEGNLLRQGIYEHTSSGNMAGAIGNAFHPRIMALKICEYVPEQPPLPMRQLHIIRGIALGLTNRELADRLRIGERTVKKDIRELIQDKLHLPNRNAVATYAFVGGLATWRGLKGPMPPVSSRA